MGSSSQLHTSSIPFSQQQLALHTKPLSGGFRSRRPSEVSNRLRRGFRQHQYIYMTQEVGEQKETVLNNSRTLKRHHHVKLHENI